MGASRAFLAVACAALLAGCTGGGSGAGVSNVPGAFSYGGQMSGKDGMETHIWRNDQDKAMASWGGQVTAGSFTLIVKDAGARQVLHEVFHKGNEGRTIPTGRGAPGEWTVVLIFDDASGSMGLSLVSGGGSGTSAGSTAAATAGWQPPCPAHPSC